MADITTTSTSGMPAWLQPYAAGYIQRAQQVADTPYQAYTQPLVASMTPWQQQGYAAQAQRAMSGSPVLSAANTAVTGMMQGGGAATANPYGQIGTFQGGAPVTAGTNPYAGANPYLQQSIDAALGDVSRQWNNFQKPAWDTAMQRSGSFGNAGVAQAQALAQSEMQRNMGQIASGMRMQDYGMQQQLAEAGLNRQMQAGQFNAGLGESSAARQMQAALANAQMGESFAGRQDAMFTGGQNRALSAIGMAPTLAAQDYIDAQALQQAGGAYQNQNQALLTSNYQQFLDALQHPERQLNIMGNALGRSYGQTNTTTQPGPSTASTLLGGALTGAGLYNLLFGGG